MGIGRGRIISTPNRVIAKELIEEAVNSGARRSAACKELGICDRTYRRWTAVGEVKSDARPTAERAPPANKLNEQERQRILDVCHQEEFANLPPRQIVPRLADRGEYVGSESSIYRVLHQANEQHHRGRSKAPQPRRKPTSYCAQAPNQVWSWDVSYRTPGIRREQDAQTGSRVCLECCYQTP